MSTVYERLKALQITLPDVQPPSWMVTLPLSFLLCAPARPFMYRDESRKKKASHGSASWGRTLP